FVVRCSRSWQLPAAASYAPRRSQKRRRTLFGVPVLRDQPLSLIFSLTTPAPAADNDRMSNEPPATDPLADSEHSDTEAVLRHAFERASLDPEVARRVDERAARITEQVRQTHGVIDDETFQALLADDES